MKILITGGAGFIGSHLSETLLNMGHSVVAYDNLSTGTKANVADILKNPQFNLIEADIRDKGLLDKWVSWADEVYHLAAALGVKTIMEKTVYSISTNVLGTEAVLSLASKYNKKVLITSSSEVYGKQCGRFLKESDNRVYGPTTIRRWSYAGSKAVDEFLALAYHNEENLPIVIVRLFNTIGPRQSEHYGMVVPRFICQALASEPITVYGDGHQTRTFTHISDAVNAMTKLMALPEANGEIFNVSSGEVTSIIELANEVLAVTGSGSEMIHLSYEEVYGDSFEDMHERTPDISKIRRYIQFEPRVSLRDSLGTVVEYFQRQMKDRA